MREYCYAGTVAVGTASIFAGVLQERPVFSTINVAGYKRLSQPYFNVTQYECGWIANE